MEEALIQVGLPVSCAYGGCDKTSNIKPGTDWGGWGRWKPLHARWQWYCPKHASHAEWIKNPPLGSVAREPEAGLQDLMDAI